METPHLARFGFGEGEWSLCPHEPLRPDEDLWMQPTLFMLTSGTGSSCYLNGKRNIAYLKETVEKIYKAIRLTELSCWSSLWHRVYLAKANHLYPYRIGRTLPRLTPKERENAICKEFGLSDWYRWRVARW